MSGQAEGKLIKQMEQLKASLPHVRRYEEIDPQVKQLKAQKNKIWGEIKKIKAEEEVLNKNMELIRKDLEMTNQEKDENRN